MMKSLILAGCLFAANLFADDGNAQKTKELTAVLQSPATLFEKARACQQLGEIGDATAVPALAELLTDEHLSAYARSGLEGISDPSAAQALRTALGVVKGNLLAGVINSLAALRDPQAVGALRPLAEDPTSGVAKEALLALGRIATDESIAIIKKALDTGPDATRPDAAASCLLAAEKQLTEGRADTALALYNDVRKANVPAVYRGAATRGAILSHQSDRVAFLMEQLRTNDPVIRQAALLTIREVPDPALADALNAEIDKAAPVFQLELLSAFADCHNENSLQLLEAKTAGDEPKIRLRALEVLSSIGGPAEAGVFLKTLLANQSAAESDAAENALERLEGRQVDDLVLGLLAGAQEPRARIQLISLLEARSATNAVGELIKQGTAPDEAVDVAAWGALGALAGTGETPALIALTKSSKSMPTRDAAEKAIIRAVSRNGNTNAAGEAALGELKSSTEPVEKNSWVRILSALGYAPALPTLEIAMTDADETVAANALESLGDWPDPAPVESLLAVVDSSSNPKSRQRAVASVIQLATVAADEHQRPDGVVVGWLAHVSAAAQSIAEQRRIISVLGRLKLAESFRLLLPWLDQPDLQAEAGIAVVQIAPALLDSEDSPALKRALETIATTTKDHEIQEQATKLAASIRAQSVPEAHP
jgi:HEAT repeat protein